MSIQRYGNPSHDYMTPAHADGFLVLYADHVAALLAQQNEFGVTLNAAVAAAEQRGYENGCIHGAAKYPDIYLAGVKAARDAVAALPAYYAIEECQGNPLEKGDPEDPDPWKQGHLIERDDALAAIDGVEKP